MASAFFLFLLTALPAVWVSGMPTLTQCSTQYGCTSLAFHLVPDECGGGGCMWEVCWNLNPKQCPVPTVKTATVCTQDADCAGEANWTDLGTVTGLTECQRGPPGATLSFALFQSVLCETTSTYFVRGFESSLNRPLDAAVSCQPAPEPQLGCGPPVPSYLTFSPHCLWQVTLPSGCIEAPDSPSPSVSPSVSPNASTSPSPSLSASPSPSPLNPMCWEVNGTEYCRRNCTAANGTVTECTVMIHTPSPSPVTASHSPSPVSASESPSPASPSYSPSPVNASDSPSPVNASDSSSVFDTPSDSPSLNSPSDGLWESPQAAEPSEDSGSSPSPEDIGTTSSVASP